MALAACRSTPPQPSPVVIPPPTLAPTPTPVPPPTALPSPTLGPRLFTIGLAVAPGTLDPAQAVDESALLITRHLYEGLAAYAPGSTRAEPALAEAWQVSADGLTWTFRLRAGVRFSDGAALTAEAAAQNVERWLRRTPPGDYAFWQLMFGGHEGEADENGDPLSLVARAAAVDDQTLEVVLHRPDASLLNTLAMPSFALVNPTAFASPGFGTPGSPSAGTGPFALQRWTSAGLIQLTRHLGYWGTPPAPDGLVFKVIADDTQRLLALQVRELDAMARLRPADFAAASSPAFGTRMEFDPALNVLYLGFNQARGPWDTLDCRLAVAHALNKPRYVQAYFSGDAEVAVSMLPPGVWGAPQSAPPATPAYDPALAAERWQACVDSGALIPETILLYVPPVARAYLPDPAGLGAAIQSDLAQVGIRVQITSPDWQIEWLPDVQSGRADLFLLGWVGLNGDPDSFLCPLFCGLEAAFNSDQRGQPLPPDEVLGNVLVSARTTVDLAQREALYAEAHQLIAERAPAVPLAHRKTAWAYRADVQGTVVSPIENVFFNLTLEP